MKWKWAQRTSFSKITLCFQYPKTDVTLSLDGLYTEVRFILMWNVKLMNLDFPCISLLVIWCTMAQFPKVNLMIQTKRNKYKSILKRVLHWIKTSFDVTYNVEEFELFCRYPLGNPCQRRDIFKIYRIEINSY